MTGFFSSMSSIKSSNNVLSTNKQEHSSKLCRPTNYILNATHQAKQVIQPALKKWDTLSSMQRIIFGTIALMVLFWPVVIVIGFLPVLLAVASVAYIAWFGFDCFVGHIEEVLSKEFGCSDKTIKSMHDNVDKVKAQVSYLSSGV